MAKTKSLINIDEDIRNADWPKRTDDRVPAKPKTVKPSPDGPVGPTAKKGRE